MSRITKEINRAARINDFAKLAILGKIDFEIYNKHLTGQNGRIVHKQEA